MRTMIISALAVFAVFAGVNAGTVMMKDGTTVSDVIVVSIEEGKMTVSKDGRNVTIPMSRIKGYYHTDFGGSGGELEIFSDYTVSLANIAIKSDSSKNRKSSNCEISYSITRVGENRQHKRIRAPYFYLYVMLAADKDSGNREVQFYYYPKDARVGSKSGINDRGALMKTLSSFDRSIVHLDHLRSNIGDRKITIPLKSARERKIIAYKLEVYGATDIVAEREWRDPGHMISKNNQWWKNY